MMNMEGHFAGIRRLEGPEAEARARAAANGEKPANIDPPAPPSASQLEGLFELIKLVSNGQAVKRAQEATASHDKAKAEADAAIDRLKQAQAEHDKACADREAKLAAEREAFEQHRNAALTDIADREAETKKLQEQARADASAASALKADLQRRLDLIANAAA